MAALGTRRKRPEPDVEINMVPIMNMFLVLIPFLLMSASFLHLKAIVTSVPVRAETSLSSEDSKKKEVVVTAVVKLTYTGVRLSVTSPALTEDQLKSLDTRIEWTKDKETEMLEELVSYLRGIKNKYPKSNTLILSPADDVIYKDIVTVMDVARNSGETTLFPIVVVSGEVSSS